MAAKKYLKQGELSRLAGVMNEKPATVRGWRRRDKLEEYIDADGTLDVERAALSVHGKIAPKQQQSVNHRWQEQGAGALVDETTEKGAVIADYIKESLGDIEGCDIAELQRRNELEKLLMARLKRAEYEKTFVPVDYVKKEIGDMILIIKNGILAMPDRWAAILAPETDAREIRRVLREEGRALLQQFSDEFLVSGGYKTTAEAEAERGE